MTKHTTFWEKADRAGECWLWRVSTDKYGYGQLTYQGRHRMAHHVSFELTHGEIPTGKCVLHTCDTPACINPDHLYLGTKKQNTADMLQRGRDGHGRMPGSTNPNAKLTEDDVRTIRWMHANGTLTNRRIAQHFGVTEALISIIVKRKAWKHVE